MMYINSGNKMLWNNLEHDVKDARSMFMFKKNVKLSFLKKYKIECVH